MRAQRDHRFEYGSAYINVLKSNTIPQFEHRQNWVNTIAQTSAVDICAVGILLLGSGPFRVRSGNFRQVVESL